MSQGIAKVTSEVLQAFADAWNRHDAEALMSFMTEDCVFEASAGPDACGTRYVGRGAVQAGYAEVWATFADAHWGNARHFVQGDRGVSEWTFTGTRADGTRVEVNGCDLFTFRDGKIALKNSYRKNRPSLPALRGQDLGDPPSIQSLSAKMTINYANPAGVHAPLGLYSHTASVPEGTELIFISGQVGVRPDGSTPTSIEEQADQVFTNILALLKSHGLGATNIVKLTTFMVAGQNGNAVRAARAKHLGAHRPASTAVFVSQLVDPAWLVEVEAVAAKRAAS